MTIDEAIQDLIYDAQCNRADLDIEWAERNEQIAEWLKELKFIRQWKTDVMEGFCKYDASSFEEIVHNARNKAINDFAEKLKTIIEKDLANPDLMLQCKQCGIWKAKDIEEIVAQMKTQ